MPSKFLRCAALIIVLAGVTLSPVFAAEPPARERPIVPITFLPPPLENATYAVGIFEAKTGKLVRRLHESAPERAFTAGLNGLITSWDRKDDAGKTVPAGHYAARGFAVGPLKVEGVDFIGNEWVDEDEDLRVIRVEAIALVPNDGGLAVLCTTPTGRELLRFSGKDGALMWRKTVRTDAPLPPSLVIGNDPKRGLGSLIVGSEIFQSEDGSPISTPASARPLPEFTEGSRSQGKEGTFWVIADGTLSQHSATDENEILRQLPTTAGEPTPRAVSASPQADRLYLLEDTDGWQRVRGLEWTENKQEGALAVSEWKTFFERSIRRPDPALGLEDQATASAPSSMVEMNLVKNPLAGRGKRAAGSNVVKLRAGLNEKGSYLETADGLRLRKISERPHLRAVKLVKAADKPGALTFYQTDGAAWDEFLITGTQRLMAFDAGEFELSATGEKMPEGESATKEPRDL